MNADTGATPAAPATIVHDDAPLYVGAGLACAAAVWLVAPSVAWFDSGELGAAAVQLGVPHPTGFPGFCLAGHTARQVPVGSAGMRIHLAGAACAALAVAVWLRAGLDAAWSRGGRAAVLAAAATLPLAVPALALHVRATEVYAPVWLVAALTVAACVQWPAGRRLWAMAALWGFGAGLHVEAALLPGLGWLVSAASLWRRPALWVGSGALGCTVAATAIAYLPLAAERQPLLNWGDPSTAAALIDHWTAASIREAFAGRIGGAWADVIAMGRLLAGDGGVLLVPSALGVAATWRTARPWLAWTVGLLVADLAYSLLVNPMGLRDRQAGLVALVALCALAARGVAAAALLAIAQRRAEPAAAAALAALVVLALAGTADAGQTDLRAGALYADLLLRRAAPGSTLITASDHAGSACAWLQGAEGVRPDAACVPGVFLRQDRQTAQVAHAHRRPEWAAAIGHSGAGARTAAWLAAAPRGTPVAWQVGLSAEDAALGAALAPGWPWSALADRRPAASGAQPAAAPALADAATTACAELAADDTCRSAPTLAAAIAAELAVHAALRARSDGPTAEALARAAVRLAQTPKALHNLAALVVGRDPQLALAACERALDLEPDYARAHRVAARAALALGRFDVSADHAQSAADSIADLAERERWVQGLLADAPPAARAVLRAALTP